MLAVDGWLISKNRLSSNWNLKLGSMKVEWLVIVRHHRTVNTLSIQVQTARQAPKGNLGGIYREYFNFQESNSCNKKIAVSIHIEIIDKDTLVCNGC